MRTTNRFLGIFAGAILACGAANASGFQDTFDFETGSSGQFNNSTNIYSNTTTALSSTSITVYGGALSASGVLSANGTLNQSANVGEYGGAGVGICDSSDGGSGCNSPEHQIDDGSSIVNSVQQSTSTDFLLLQFSSAVNLNSATLMLGNFGCGNGAGITGCNMDLQYWTSTTSLTNSGASSNLTTMLSNLTGKTDTTLANNFTSDGTINTANGIANGATATDTLAASGLNGVTYLLIAAAGTAANPSYFKVQDLQINAQYSAAPEPATFGMIGLALAGLGVARRRKRNS
jgi:hypothetical protein